VPLSLFSRRRLACTWRVPRVRMCGGWTPRARCPGPPTPSTGRCPAGDRSKADLIDAAFSTW